MQGSNVLGPEIAKFVPLQLPIPNEIPQGCAADADQSRG
jgi:hypothetical protein